MDVHIVRSSDVPPDSCLLKYKGGPVTLALQPDDITERGAELISTALARLVDGGDGGGTCPTER